MAARTTHGGVRYDPRALDTAVASFWRGIWESVPAPAAAEHGIELRRFGPLQASVVADLGSVGTLNLVLGAAEEGAVAGGHLAAAIAWARERGAIPRVPLTPGLPGSAAAEEWLRGNGFEPGHGLMKFARDAHPPRFKPPAAVEVVELSATTAGEFGMLAATGFGMPAWAATFFAQLPGREGWRCYLGRVDGQAAACGATLIAGEVAFFGVGATLEAARRRSCQLALLHRRIADAVEAGCRTLFVETGERAEDRPAGSYRNILSAGFEEAYLCPSWKPLG